MKNGYMDQPRFCDAVALTPEEAGRAMSCLYALHGFMQSREAEHLVEVKARRRARAVSAKMAHKGKLVL